MHCATDINKAVEDCADIPPDDEHALLKCIEDAMISAADCIGCICEILMTIYGMDLEPCHAWFEFFLSFRNIILYIEYWIFY